MLNIRKRKEGFTIIEVLIVLAIAGLILLIVFLAVPALQRNGRNTQRKNDAAALLGGMSEFVNNNSGTMPDTITQVSGSKFAITKGAYAAATNPGTPLNLGFYNTNASITVTSTIPASAPAADTIMIITSATCNGNTPTGGAAARSYVAYYSVEPGTTGQCQGS